MNRHPYLRAYMAGVLLPNWFLLVGIAVFAVVHPTLGLSIPVERAFIFPMAVVPNLWGVWNLLYVALVLKRRIPLGIWGALLPVIIGAAALLTAPLLAPNIIGPADVLAVAPIGIGAYYLLWKHAVGFFNRLVGVD